MDRPARKRLLLATESDSTAFDATHAVRTGNIEPTPVQGDEITREQDRPYLGNDPSILTNPHQGISFPVEFAVGGAAGVVPAWGLLLRACGFSETVVPELPIPRAPPGSVTYRPVTDNPSSVKLGFNQSGRLHTLTGARGSVSFTVAANQIPLFNFNFLGKWNDPLDIEPLAGDFSGYADPLYGSRLHTPTFTAFGQSTIPLNTFSADMSNEVVHASPINADPETHITGRSPTGSISVRDHGHDFFSAAKDANDGIITLVHGIVGGRQITVTIPKAQVQPNVTYEETNGITGNAVPFRLLPSGAAGNDEISIVIT